MKILGLAHTDRTRVYDVTDHGLNLFPLLQFILSGNGDLNFGLFTELKQNKGKIFLRSFPSLNKTPSLVQRNLIACTIVDSSVNKVLQTEHDTEALICR